MIAFPDPPFTDGQTFTDPDSGREFRFDEALPGWRFVSDGAAPPALPPALPDVTLSAAGAGSSQSAPRVFDINIDVGGPGSPVYRLQSSDLVQIYYALQFDLTNLSPGSRKHILIDMRNLYRPQFIALSQYGPQSGPRQRAFATGSPIRENGNWPEGEWVGRENIMLSSWWSRGMELAGMMAGSMGRWRDTWGPGTITGDRMHTKQRFYRAFNQIADTMAIMGGKGWSLGSMGMGFGSPPEGPRAIRATFEYYSATWKFVTFETYYRLPRPS